jgi:hypothetical protein
LREAPIGYAVGVRWALAAAFLAAGLAFLLRRRREADASARGRLAALRRPNVDLEDLSRDELYRRAQEADIPGRSDMTKDELIHALRSAR